MNKTEALEKLLQAFGAYYNVKTEDVMEPFDAEAMFHTHDEQYFLLKAAKLAESESHETAYFAIRDQLDLPELLQLDEIAWSRGLEGVVPSGNHRNTDVSLVLVVDSLTKEAREKLPKLQHYKSYRFGFQGWSQYRLIALELSEGRVTCNRQGRSLEKLVRNILKA